MKRTTIPTLLAMLLTTTGAYAQAQYCSPYEEPCATELARRLSQPTPGVPQCINPYGIDAVRCSVPTPGSPGTETPVAPTVYKFGEGVVHAPGSELAWVILTNFDTVPQTAIVELLVSGRLAPITRSLTLAPKERKDLALHGLPELQGMATFSTGVYFPLATGHAALVMRPLLETFSRVTLPPPTVTQAR